MTLESGVEIAIPVVTIGELHGASPKQLRELELAAQGTALHQDEGLRLVVAVSPPGYEPWLRNLTDVR